MRDFKGQNFIEFAIILAVLVFGGIAVYSILGNNINNMFSGSRDTFNEYKPFDWDNKTSSTIEVSGSAGLKVDPGSGGGTTSNLNGVEISYNGDGSASFNVGNQQVSLSPNTMKSLNTVFETSGSSGGQLDVSVLNAIQKLITEHADEYPDGVPVEIAFGTGIRSMGSVGGFSGGTYKGDASVNSAVLSVGDHKILIQQDQNCDLSEGAGVGYGCNQAHTVEINNGKGIVSSPFEFMNGLELKNLQLDKNGFPITGSFPAEQNFSGGSWTFDFTKAQSSSI